MRKALCSEDLGIIALRAPSASGDFQRKHGLGAAQVRRFDRVFQIVGEVRARGFLFAIGGKGDEVFLPGVEPAILVNAPPLN